MKGTINGNRLPRGTKIKKKVGNANHYSTPFCRRLAHMRGNVLVRGPAVPTSGIFKINYRKIRRDFLLTLSVVWSVLYHIILYHIIYHIIAYRIIYRIISYHIIPYHIVSYHIISYHIIYHIIAYRIISYIISYRIIPYHIISYHIIYHIIAYRINIVSYHISYRIVSYLIISYSIISYRIVSYIISYLILSYRIISYIISYHIISFSIISYIIPYHIISYHILYYIICGPSLTETSLCNAYLYCVCLCSCILQTIIITTNMYQMHIGLYFIYNVVNGKGKGTRWCSWLRHWATSRKVAGSIPDGVFGIFHWHNPSGRTMALGMTQPLTEMSTRSISWGGG